MISVDARKAIQDLRRAFAQLTPDEVNTAISRAENHTISVADTQARKTVRQIYNIKAGVVRKAIQKQPATKWSLTAALLASVDKVHLSAFAPRQTKKGVTIRIKNQRKLIPSAFLAVMKTGHEGVFARGRYGSKDFSFRKHRIKKGSDFRMINGRPVPIDVSDLPINELYTLNVHKMFDNDIMLSNIREKVDKHFPERLMHEIMYLLEKRGAK